MTPTQNIEAASTAIALLNAFLAFGGTMRKTATFTYQRKAGKGYIVSGMSRIPLSTDMATRVENQIAAMLDAETQNLVALARELLKDPAVATVTATAATAPASALTPANAPEVRDPETGNAST